MSSSPDKAWKLASQYSSISISFIKDFDYKIDFGALALNQAYYFKRDIVEILKYACFVRTGSYNQKVNPLDEEPKMEKGFRKIATDCGLNFIEIHRKIHDANIYLPSVIGGFLLDQGYYNSIDEADLYWACKNLDDLCENFVLLYIDNLSSRCWSALAERNKYKKIFSDEFVKKYKVQLEVEDDTDNGEGVEISKDCAEDIDYLLNNWFNKTSEFDLSDFELGDTYTLYPRVSNLITDNAIRYNSGNQYYSEDFLRHFAPLFSEATWTEISKGQQLSTRFLKDFYDKINWDLISKSIYRDSSIDYAQLREQILKDKKETKTMATTKGTNTMAANVTTMIKSDGLKASYRMASRQMVKGVIKALLAALDSKYTPDQLKFLEELLKTDLGYALVSGMIGMGLTYAPVEKIQSNPHLQVLAEEFRVSAIDTVGTKVLDTIMDNFLPVIMECANLLPQEVETTEEGLNE